MMHNQNKQVENQWNDIDKRRFLINTYFTKHIVENTDYDKNYDNTKNMVCIGIGIKKDENNKIVNVFLNSNYLFKVDLLGRDRLIIYDDLKDVLKFAGVIK
jgi:hypothetical protein